MPVLFWCIVCVMLLSSLVGVVASLRLYDRIGGGPSSAADLDRIVRESW